MFSFISQTDIINTEETTGTSSHTKICLLKKILGFFGAIMFPTVDHKHPVEVKR